MVCACACCASRRSSRDANVHIVSLNLIIFSRAFRQQLQPAVTGCGRLASPAREEFASVAWRVSVCAESRFERSNAQLWYFPCCDAVNYKNCKFQKNSQFCPFCVHVIPCCVHATPCARLAVRSTSYSRIDCGRCASYIQFRKIR